ncbi:Gpa2p [Saccharomyces cerevisiae x Saccharomyces kudriavzevii VIN7]|uniref:Guanine nucleotide-binding protein alpha-2 subunit n=1 Tax=Saccharomyces cerevisiae x Saccharomyces kudriavzevii (strain VIN7) TaxID=1095631 RepID=H0GTS3_SACCK|nr:Gpa2p [Saccharomyces cerevisiae x Saccharomyces kudriavzevii VIN7]
MGLCASSEKNGNSSDTPATSARSGSAGRAKVSSQQQQPQGHPQSTARTASTVSQQQQQQQQQHRPPAHDAKNNSISINNAISPTATANTSGSQQINIDSALRDRSTNGPAQPTVSDASSGSNGKEFKVLLLGAGESGKSTVLQQLKILHQNGFTEQEIKEYIPLIYQNLLEIGRSIIQARTKFSVNLEPDCDLTQQDLAKVLSYEVPNNYTRQFPTDIAAVISKLWALPSTQTLIDGPNASKFYLMDSTPYFMENFTRVTSPNYRPTQQDILRSRQMTSGIFDTVIDMGSDIKMHIYDVGGQRSERKKWIHCFDNVTLVIFCVSLSEYDQALMEDRNQNRFQESLVLFDNIVNSRWFARTSVVLFLNKIDLFAEKLGKVPMQNYFPDYTGGSDINKAAKYILWRFVQLNRANLSIYPHVTQATDTSNIKLVFAAIKETILENTLKDSGVLQ